jgi:hypothetical protein
MLKRIGAVLVGLVFAVAIIIGNEFMDATIYPPPAGIDWSKGAAVNAYIASLPVGALLIVLIGWTFATFVGACIALRICAGKRLPASAELDTSAGQARVLRSLKLHTRAGRNYVRPAWMIALVLMVGAVYDMISFAHPLWFWIAMLALIPCAALWAAQISNRS